MDQRLMNGNKWAHDLFDVCSYTDINGKSPFCPYFCPMSTMGTCCIVGRIQTILEKEDPIFCEMGSKGLCCCLMTLPFNFFGPFGGFFCFSFASMNFRNELLNTKGLKEQQIFPCCNETLIGFCYPW